MLVLVGPEVPGVDDLAAPNKLDVVAAGAGVEVVAALVEVAFPKSDGVCAGAGAAGAGVDVAGLGFPNRLLVAGAAGAGVVEACVPGVLAAGVAEGKLKDGAGLAASVVAAGVELAGGAAEAAGLFPPNMLPLGAEGFVAPAPPNKLLGAAAAGVPLEKRPPVGADAAGVCVGCDAAVVFGVPNRPPVDCDGAPPPNKFPVLAAGALFVGGGPAGVVDAKLKGLLGAGVVDPKLGVLEAAPPNIPPPAAGLFIPENIPPVGVAGLFSVVGVEAPSGLGPPKLKPPLPPVDAPPPPNSPPPAEVVGVVLAVGFPKLKEDVALGAFPVLWPKIPPAAGFAAPVFAAPAPPKAGACAPAGFGAPNRDDGAAPDVAGAPPNSPAPELLGGLLELPPPNNPPPVLPVLPNVNPDIL